jgi:translocation and assembly module TamB
VAQIIIGGLASAPRITLSSLPPLPQNEILSRVLFNQGKGQINAAQGLQLAQAAAALTGQNFDVLERLRGRLGLDWLGFGSGPQGAAPSIVNPKPQYGSQANAGGSAISAGKYIAPGVSIGVTQGVSPPTSKVTVEIELGHHLTIGTSAGAIGGAGIGLNYNYNY